jgi:transposase
VDVLEDIRIGLKIIDAAALSPTITEAKLASFAKMREQIERRVAAHPAHRLDELLPWNWKTVQQQGLAMQAA